MSLASCYPIIIIIIIIKTLLIIVKLITVSINGRRSGVTNGPPIGIGYCSSYGTAVRDGQS